MANAEPTTVHSDQQPGNGRPAAKAQADGSVFRILASASLADERTRVLKHANTFAVFDHYGDITHDGLGEEGIYHDGTRFLSGLLLELERARPFFLSSTVRDENDQLAVALTNPDLLDDNEMRLPLGTLHLAVRRFLWNGVCHQQLRINNHGLGPVKTSLGLHFEADYADIFEVRGMKRKARGEDLPAEVSGDTVVFGYRGLDGVVRRTRLKFDPPPTGLTSSAARMEVALRPQQDVTFTVSIACERESTVRDSTTRGVPHREMTVRPIPRFEEARAQAQSDLEKYSAWSCHLRT